MLDKESHEYLEAPYRDNLNRSRFEVIVHFQLGVSTLTKASHSFADT